MFDSKSVIGGISEEDFVAVSCFAFMSILPEHVLVDEWFGNNDFGDWCSHQAGFVLPVSSRMSQPHPKGAIFKTVIIQLPSLAQSSCSCNKYAKLCELLGVKVTQELCIRNFLPTLLQIGHLNIPLGSAGHLSWIPTSNA